MQGADSRQQLTRILTLTVLLLLGFRGIGFGGVRVGGSGGVDVSGWQRTTYGCASTSAVQSRRYDELARGELHVDVDVAGAPGLRFGAGGGVRMFDSLQERRTFDGESGAWVLTDQTSEVYRTWVGWGGLRWGGRTAHFESEGTLGLAHYRPLNAEGVPTGAYWQPFIEGRIGAGALGLAAYEFRGRVWGDSTRGDTAMVHGLRILGGRLPSGWLGVELGPGGNYPSAGVAFGVDSPFTWRVQPSVSAVIGGPRTWSVTVGVDVLIGRRFDPAEGDWLRERGLAPE